MDRRAIRDYIATMTEHIDARGLLCPLPVLKARKRLLQLPAGATLEIVTDDPAAVIDMPHFCAEAGYELAESREMADGMSWRIVKPV